jgi:hypothetical protein
MLKPLPESISMNAIGSGAAVATKDRCHVEFRPKSGQSGRMSAP